MFLFVFCMWLKLFQTETLWSSLMCVSWWLQRFMTHPFPHGCIGLGISGWQHHWRWFSSVVNSLRNWCYIFLFVQKYVCFFLVSTHGIMFEQTKVGNRFKTNYWFLILVHVWYGLEAATNRIFKSKEGNNMKGEYPF